MTASSRTRIFARVNTAIIHQFTTTIQKHTAVANPRRLHALIGFANVKLGALVVDDARGSAIAGWAARVPATLVRQTHSAMTIDLGSRFQRGACKTIAMARGVATTPIDTIPRFAFGMHAAIGSIGTQAQDLGVGEDDVRREAVAEHSARNEDVIARNRCNMASSKLEKVRKRGPGIVDRVKQFIHAEAGRVSAGQEHFVIR